MGLAFQVPDWRAPLDVETYLTGVPPGGTVKGLFFRALADAVGGPARLRGAPDRYLPFRDYPMRDYLEVLLETARTRYPHLPIREALRRLGANAYSAFEATTVGKVIFSVAAGKWPLVLAACPKAYQVSVQPSSVRVAERGDGYAIVEMRGLWVFPDCYQIGVFEGAMRVLGEHGVVRVRTRSSCDVDLELHW